MFQPYMLIFLLRAINSNNYSDVMLSLVVASVIIIFLYID